jgi:hypothetical protein
MSDKKHDNELIVKYLQGSMSDSERAEFESRITREESLREELNEIAELRVGLEILEKIGTGHPTPETLEQYAEDSSQLGQQEIIEIREHLESCPQCAEEVALCQDSAKITVVPRLAVPKSTLSRVVDTFFLRSISLRPAYALVATLLLVFVGYFGGRTLISPGQGVSTFEIMPVDTRGAEHISVVTLAGQMVELHLVVPVRNDRFYDFELQDSAGVVVLALLHNAPQKVFALQIPASYLAIGRYKLNVVERDDSGTITGQFEYPFIVDSDR